MKPADQRGFSLIELMVTLTVFGILLVIGIPTYQQWTLNTRIRTATESIQNGLRLARNEASQRGTNVRFYLFANTAGAAEWTVCLLPTSAASAATVTTCPLPPAGSSSTLQSFVNTGDTTNLQVGAATAVADITGNYSSIMTGGVPGGITFNALGRPTDYGNTSIIRIDVTAAQASAQANSRSLVTTISAGGMVNMCDPQITFSANSPQGCP
ncbi:prepilin-type N-terminal cleavage/methylation domain-containing protein [Rhodanobacter sp. MP1X3]|uniref:prepilin-type N-terminal cleavage/methylation domain-containing protein n=1 Tax=Rhodanobacter sp. MP1X3 TaxID=2723086 RepID=UPI00161CE9B1|nr:prepilin-type N-terminal cleavage/methylation domain-containing protein [Rhodanobacter sp. MP1X3]MBB6244772.1 type IV fimbrial biogenesis protein FimT [Rhodanobacter sp. MP1X3]